MSNSCKILVGLRTRPKKNCDGAVVQSEPERNRIVVKVPNLGDFEKVRRNLNRGDQVIQRIIGSDPSKLNVYTYDKVYGPDSSQVQIYQDFGTVILENCLQGYNSCLFAYGQTGSGKTHTMMGPGTDCEDEQKGIIPRLCAELFERTTQTDLDEGGDVKHRIEVSMIEIYNEKVKDLFTNLNNLEVREKGKNNFVIPTLSRQVVQSTNEIQNWLEIGSSNRTIAKTLMNDTSSRAHTIFQIHLTRTEEVREEQGKVNLITRSVVNLIDLAGSEQMSTAIMGNETKLQDIEQRKKELIEINKSLSALGRCIKTLHEKFSKEGKNTKKKKKFHIPFRDSTLTKLIANSLGGNAKTIMIATLSPNPYHYEQTISTCRFADRVKNIKNKPVINIDPKERIIKELREKIKNLELEIETNKTIVATQQEDEIITVEEEECEGEDDEVEEKEEEQPQQQMINDYDPLQSPKSKKYTDLKERYQEVVAENEEMKNHHKTLKYEKEALIKKIKLIKETQNDLHDELGRKVADLTHQKDNDIVEVKAQKGVLEKKLEISKKLLKKQIIERRRMEHEKQKLMSKVEDNQKLLNEQISQFRILETRQQKLHEKNADVLVEKQRVEEELENAQEKLDEHVTHLEQLQRQKNELEREKSDLEEHTREEEDKRKKMKEELGLIESSMKLLEFELEQQKGEYLQKESESERKVEEVTGQFRRMEEEREALQITLTQSNEEILLQAQKMEANYDSRLALEAERSELLGNLDMMKSIVEERELERSEVEETLQSLITQNRNLSKTLKANEKRIQMHQIQITTMEGELNTERAKFLEKTEELGCVKKGRDEAQRRIQILQKKEKMISQQLQSQKEMLEKKLNDKQSKIDDQTQKIKELHSQKMEVERELRKEKVSQKRLVLSLEKKNDDLGKKKVKLDNMDRKICEMKSTVRTHRTDYAGQMHKMKREKAQLWAQKSFLEKKLQLSTKIIFKQRRKIDVLERQHRVDLENMKKKLESERRKFREEIKREREHWQKMKSKKDEVLKKARNMLNQHHKKFRIYKKNQMIKKQKLHHQQQLNSNLPRQNIRQKLHRNNLNRSIAVHSSPSITRMERKSVFVTKTENKPVKTTKTTNVVLSTPQKNNNATLAERRNLVLTSRRRNNRSMSTPLSSSPRLTKKPPLKVVRQQSQPSKPKNQRKENHHQMMKKKKMPPSVSALEELRKKKFLTLQQRRNKQKEEKDNTKSTMWYEQVSKFMKSLM